MSGTFQEESDRYVANLRELVQSESFRGGALVMPAAQIQQRVEAVPRRRKEEVRLNPLVDSKNVPRPSPRLGALLSKQMRRVGLSSQGKQRNATDSVKKKSKAKSEY